LKQYRVGRADELAPGERRIVELDGRSVGVFNVGGRFHALLNWCPHQGAPVCLGRVTGTTLPADEEVYVYGRDGEILRCAWHGWEFEIATGRGLADPRMRVKTYAVSVDDGELVVSI
jgi:nitrite reductase/ring-hydroxylating ferredoxin subunit